MKRRAEPDFLYIQRQDGNANMQHHGDLQGSINGTSYGSGTTGIGRAALTRAEKPIPSEPKLDLSVKKIPFVNFVDVEKC